MSTETQAGSLAATLHEIDVLIRARYPLLYLLTHEEARIEALLLDIAKKQSKKLYTWTATAGLQEFNENSSLAPPASQAGQYTDPNELLSHIQTTPNVALYALKDFHTYLEDPQIVRRLRDLAHDLKATYKNVLIVSPRLNLPVELEKDISLIDIPLPDPPELLDLLKSVCATVVRKNKSAVNLNGDDANAIVRAAQGLTLTEAENVFAKAVVSDAVMDRRDVDLILKEKQQLIRKSGILDFYPTESSLDDIGGLKNLKHWLTVRGKAFGSQAGKFGLPAPKGVLLLGAPGCGKSLTAKAIARTWQMPLLRLDFGRIFSGLVGSSEENMRRALKVAEGVAPAVLWIDEIEKGRAGGVSGSSDGGTAARVFGTFLTWMQEKSAKVFVVATANRIDLLPPELLRRGRFDEIFFADLPDEAARKEILAIHLKKKNRPSEKFELDAIIHQTNGFSGAEIEHSVIEGLFAAFHENRELLTADIIKAAKETVPLSVTYAEELKRLREWAKNRARPADVVATATASTSKRASLLEVDGEQRPV
jgi:ATP-dependent 26S proteasome regulatory subunit